MKLTAEEKRARAIARAIRLSYDSLRSHLPYTFSGEMIRGEDYAFHQRCVKGYSKLICLLSTLY